MQIKQIKCNQSFCQLFFCSTGLEQLEEHLMVEFHRRRLNTQTCNKCLKLIKELESKKGSKIRDFTIFALWPLLLNI